jgi:hypothetical protein
VDVELAGNHPLLLTFRGSGSLELVNVSFR